MIDVGVTLDERLVQKARDALEPLSSDLEPPKRGFGHKLVVEALEELDKAEVLRKHKRSSTTSSRKGHARRYGQGEKGRLWIDLRQLDQSTQLSDDLYARGESDTNADSTSHDDSVERSAESDDELQSVSDDAERRSRSG